MIGLGDGIELIAAPFRQAANDMQVLGWKILMDKDGDHA
jgi:hypothetical protein